MSKFRVLTVLILSAALAACGAKAVQQPPPSVTVAKPVRQMVSDWDDYVGQFVAVDSVDIRPRVSGYLQTVGFQDGQIVHKGQILFVIDPRPYQAALDQAQGQAAHADAALANAHTESQRGQQLLAAHAISQQAYDLLVATERQDAADVIAARANVQTAALNLGFTKVTAPLSGRISDRRVAPGNLVTADTTVLTNIVNLDPIRFAFTGSEALYLKYQRQSATGVRPTAGVAPTAVEIRLQDETTYRWHGRVDFVDNTIDPGSGTIRGRAVIDNHDYFLTPGMFGHMRLTGEGPQSALLVPDAAVITDQTRQIVYVADKNGMIAERDVVPGQLINGLRVIQKGLNDNDLVVIDGIQRARPGHKVTAAMGRIDAQPTDSAG